MIHKKILVTGGAGFIGGNFVHYMVNKYPKYMIVNLDALTYAGNLETCKPVEDKPNYKFVKGDIADREFIFNLFEKEKFDIVVNFAAESHVDRSVTDPEIFIKTNVLGTQVLLDALVHLELKVIIKYLLMKYMVIYHWTSGFILYRRNTFTYLKSIFSIKSISRFISSCLSSNIWITSYDITLFK